MTGSNLISFNDVTKRAITSIDLKKAVAVEDVEEMKSPTSSMPTRYLEYEGPYGVERSFRVLFQGGTEIAFFADTDEEKDAWYVLVQSHAAIRNS